MSIVKIRGFHRKYPEPHSDHQETMLLRGSLDQARYHYRTLVDSSHSVAPAGLGRGLETERIT